MPLKPKDTAVQFRIDAESFELFQTRCEHYGETVSQAIRDAIRMMNSHYLKQHSQAQNSPSTTSNVQIPTEVSPSSKKTLVEPIRQPSSLSERRKAEKLAKTAKQTRRESRHLDD